MCLFLFFSLSSSVWWKFQSRHWQEKVINSHKTPLLVLVYQTSCVHCNGLPELHQKYSDEKPDRTDVIFTAVDCDYQLTCRHFPVTSYPTYMLVVGDNPRYWQIIESRNPKDWEEYIERYTKFELKEINSTTELTTEIFRSMYGGTIFYAGVPSKDDELLKILGPEIRKFVIFNVSFVYRVNPEIETATFTAYRSPFCSITFKGPIYKSEIFAFINEYKFGHLHQYDDYEWFEESGNRRTLINFEYSSLSQENREKLAQYSTMFCENTSIGWISATKAPLAVRGLRINYTEMPILVAANKETNCIASFDVTNVAAARAALSSQLCMPRFGKVWGTALIRTKLSGLNVTIILCAAGCTAILLIRLYESYVSKDE
jgi:hypothetical protein